MQDKPSETLINFLRHRARHCRRLAELTASSFAAGEFRDLARQYDAEATIAARTSSRKPQTVH
jgi:hypothetical protein